MILNSKSHSVWGLFYFETVSNLRIPSTRESPIFGCTHFLISGSVDPKLVAQGFLAHLSLKLIVTYDNILDPK